MMRRDAPRTRCRCRCSAGVCRRRRSAAHQHRADVPRRCRGLTEDVTAHAVMLRLWSSSVPPARRQQGRVESRHALLRSAYRVMAECRRSATMSADVDGDGDGVTARAVGTRHYGGWGGCYKHVMKKFGEKFAKSLCKSYLCNELRDRTLN